MFLEMVLLLNVCFKKEKVSLLLCRTQGYCYHLSKFNIYALVYSIGTVHNNPVYETAKETLMYRTVLWTLRERERVGRFRRMALKLVKYHV